MKLCLPLIACLLLASTAQADVVLRAARAQARADRLHQTASAVVSSRAAYSAAYANSVGYGYVAVAPPAVGAGQGAAVVYVRAAAPPVVRVYHIHRIGWFW